MSKRSFRYSLLFSVIFVLTLLASVCIPQNVASADMGPKPIVYIDLTGIEDGVEYYATLLSSTDGYGPWQSINEIKEYYESQKEKGEYAEFNSFEEYCAYTFGENKWEILNKLLEYNDPDGFYLLDWCTTGKGNSTFSFGYYPPKTFKVLLYFVNEDRFVVSQICERYAFSSYFKMDVNLNEILANNQTQPLSVKNNYNYAREILFLIARIIITIAIELALALLFKYKSKKALLCITITNVFTQIVLNVLLNLLNYKQGYLMFILLYLGFELLAFVIEAITYSICARKNVLGENNRSIGKAIGYALLANVLSFSVGFVFAVFVPNALT